MSRSSFGLLAAAFLALGSALAADTRTDDKKLSKDEQRLLELTNEARAKEKLSPVKANATLMKVARAHASNMARQHEMKHELDGKNPSQRIEGAGYDYKSVGENIAVAEKGATVDAVFKSWMDSKEHRDNILSPKFNEVGLGLATDDKGETYFAQDFGKQRSKE
jgi:uncharacterized protein YkwD